MRNIIANFPGLKSWINYIHAIRHKLRSKKLLIGANNELRQVAFGDHVALGARVSILNSKIDSFSYISDSTFIRNTTMGKFCSIGACCQIGLGIHPLNEFISSHPLFYSSRGQVGFAVLKETKFNEFEEVRIGSDVWIGAGAIILDGVTIGDGAVVAAGSVVTSSIDPYSIVAGAPAAHKKFRFSEEKIEEILADPWWKKDFEWIKEHLINK